MSEIRNRLHGRNHASASSDQQESSQEQQPRSSRSSPRSRHHHHGHQPSHDSFSSAVLSALFLCCISACILYYYFSDSQMSQTFSSQDIPQTDPIHKKLQIPFQTAFTGGTLSVQLDGLVRVCSSCQGTGAAPGSIHFCTSCQGTGERITRTQIFAGGPSIHIRQQCSRCQGTGKMITKQCPKCHGHRTTITQQYVDIPIHAGARSGDLIRISGLGNHMPDHTIGDLVFILEIPKESAPFKLQDNDVITTISIRLRDALLGFRTSIQHVNGDTIVVDRSGLVTSPDTTLTYKGRGWPESRDGQQSTGDLLIRFDIQYPSVLSSDNIDLLKRSLQ